MLAINNNKRKKMDKTLFIFNIDNVIAIGHVLCYYQARWCKYPKRSKSAPTELKQGAANNHIMTNSSSEFKVAELFTFKVDNGTVLYNLLQSFDSKFYETFKPVSLRKSTPSLFYNYVCTILPYSFSNEEKDNINLPDGISIGDIYEFDNYDQEWCMKREDYGDWYNKHEYGIDSYDYFEKYRAILQEWLDPTDNIWLLYIDDDMMDSDLKEKVKQISTHDFI